MYTPPNDFNFGSDDLVTIILLIINYLMIALFLFVLYKKALKKQKPLYTMKLSLPYEERLLLGYINNNNYNESKEPNNYLVFDYDFSKSNNLLLNENNINIQNQDDNDDNEVEYILDIENNQKIVLRKNYSITARRHLASMDLQSYYQDIRNLLEMYMGMKMYKSWRYDKYKIKNQAFIKISVTSNSLKVYFATDPSKIIISSYNLENIGHIKIHKDTPYLMYITGPRLKDYVMDVIKSLLINEETYLVYNPANYILPYIKKNDLIELGFIKLTKNIIKL